jgi:hypothetical protein
MGKRRIAIIAEEENQRRAREQRQKINSRERELTRSIVPNTIRLWRLILRPS